MKYLLVLLGVFIICISLYFILRTECIVTAHVINMKSSRSRYDTFMKHAAHTGLQIERWNAINGKTLHVEDLPKYNIDLPLYNARKMEKRLGVIGCYLSHSSLLEHLERINCGPNAIHLIFEDDVVLPTNIQSRIYEIINKLPSDWDLLQMYTYSPKTLVWKGEIHVPDTRTAGNWSTAAYAVRHGALAKINAHVQKMHAPIDNQLLEKAGIWKWFIIQPDLVKVDDGGKSTLNDS
jgi:GR25 family glycosyltransferase involved in LPS biosynthesis